MTIYEDYFNWKNENLDLINELIKMKSKIISRISHVIAVVDYLYNKEEKENKLEDYLENIFEHAFDYLHDHFVTINELLVKEFSDSVEEMNKFEKTINLLLYINDFENELENQDDYKKEDLNKLTDLEEKVLSSLHQHENVPDEYFIILDDITYNLFDYNYKSVNDIMYDVACELDLVKSNDSDEAIDNVFGIKENEF